MNTRLIVAKTLLWVATAAAAAAGASAVSSVLDASNDVKALHLWICIGYFTFALLFGLLAWRPRSNGALWLIAFVNKLALTLAASFYLADGSVDGAKDIVIWDGLLVVLLAVSFVLSRGKDTQPESSDANNS